MVPARISSIELCRQPVHEFLPIINTNYGFVKEETTAKRHDATKKAARENLHSFIISAGKRRFIEHFLRSFTSSVICVVGTFVTVLQKYS